MSVDDDKYIDFSIAQKDTLILQKIVKPPPTQFPMMPRTPKKMHLEQVPLSETTSAVMRVIRRVHAKSLPEYFELTCDRRQHDIAVIYESSQLTYQELDYQANRLAQFLISRGVGKGNPIGILLEHSLDTYIVLLGVLKAGAAFVPLDPSFSSEQVTFIAQDAGLLGFVTTSAFHEKTRTLSCPVLELDRAQEVLSIQEETRPQISIDPTSLCYIIYTLQASSQPQGVAVSHASIVNLLRVFTPIYGVTHNDRVYQGISITLNSSFMEIWPAWIAGATLIADPSGSQGAGHELTEFLNEHKITVLCCTSTLLATIEGDVPSLRMLFIVDSVCPPDLISRWSHSRRRILSAYGSPETTIIATCSKLFPNRPVTIGYPLPTYHIYLLDDQLCSVKDGEIGEICIGGPGVALGYINRPDLTKERFIPNPARNDRKMVPRLYRTGDAGRITRSGEIEYLGQINTQVKSQDHRTESGEIARMALILADTLPLNTYPTLPRLENKASAELDVKPSRLDMLKQLSVKNIYEQIMTDPLYKNSLFTMASTVILGGLGFVFWIIIARLYKTENVGIATTLISLMALLSDLTVMGLNAGLNRYLPKSINKNELINSSFTIVTFVTLIASVIFLLGLQIFSPPLLFLRSNLFYSISFTLFLIFFAWNILVESIFMAFRAASNILIKNSITSILKLMLPFAFIAFGAYGIFASTASAFALGVIISFGVLILKFKIRPSISVNVSLIKETSAYSFANYMAGFMFAMPALVLPVIILNTLSAKYAAYYYIASMIQNILLIIPFATGQALLTEGAYNEAELKKHVKKAIVTISAILIPATLVVIFAGNILLQFFGKSYANEAFQFLQLYSASTIFTAVLLIANAIMNVKHQIKLLVISNVLAAILTLWLSYAFISDKLVGIGWGWTLAQAIVGLLSLFFIIRTLYTQENAKEI